MTDPERVCSLLRTQYVRVYEDRSHGVHEDPEEEFDATIELNDGSTMEEYKAHRSE